MNKATNSWRVSFCVFSLCMKLYVISEHLFSWTFTEHRNSLFTAKSLLNFLWCFSGLLHFPNFSRFHKRTMPIKALAWTVAGAAGGSGLSSFFDMLVADLNSSDLLKIFRQENVDADLKKWERTLLKIHSVLEDAEEKQMTSRSVKIWLDELEDLVYDVDDILDEFATEALRRKLHEEEPSPSKIRQFITACYVGFNPSSLKFEVGMRYKIEGINKRLQEVTEREFLKLNDGAGGRTITKTSRPPTSSLVEGQTYGRDEDKNAIVKLLLESDDAQLSVIPIVGMGGLGKTTLAQIVYTEDDVDSHFELKAWVCVTEDFDNLRLTKEILHSFLSKSWDNTSTLDSFFEGNNGTLDSLQVKLKEKLSGKRFLLVLDDVWCESYDNWTILRKPFQSGARGSKIVVTTQSYHVSSKLGTTRAYELKELSSDDCLSVFTHHALGASDFSEYPELEKYGRKIVDRWMGAPLAAKAFGGLLHNKHDPHEWEDVLNSKIWDIPEIFSVLKSSYNRLPSHLKRCFAYCSLFPKDNKFKEKDLVLLWMAEGFVQKAKVKKPMEDLGGDYFRELLKRSFFQQSSNSESHFVMHDLMHDLAQWAAGGFYCRLEDQLGGNKQSEIYTKVRHFSYIKNSNDCNQKFDDLPKDMHLRTFLQLPLCFERNLTNFDDKYCLLPQLRCLRVLSLSGYTIIELPSSIGDLKHLRYLNLSYTDIKSLPKSTSSLYNLQTLILEGCSNLKKLPEKIENLVNLRHLNITGASSISEMPAGIAELKSLRTLSNFVVGKDKMVDLMNLESLQGTLCISHLENMLGANDAGKVYLKDKKNLDTLVMKWDDDLQDAQVAADILDMLRPHETVKTLSIEGYVGATFPTWLGDLSFSNMVDLRIERCGKCEVLPAFGLLPSLKGLIIKKMDRVSRVGPEFYGACEQPFRSLEKLWFENMPEWQCWNPNPTSFSSRDTLPTTLKVLKLVDCPKLESIVDELNKDMLLEEFLITCCEKLRCLPRGPHRLGHLKKITIRDCKSLSSLEDLLPYNLRILEIEDCEKLEALSNNMHNLGVLRELKLSGANLCEQVFELGLHRFWSLTSLEIAGGIMDSFPEEEDGKAMLMLPTSLTTLSFENFRNLLSLSWKFSQNHSTLEQIFIGACPKLVSLSEECFPPSLKLFHIYECPMLKKDYEKDEGIKWSEIAHIPSVIIDDVEQQK